MAFKTGYCYLMASHARTLYIGVTAVLEQRVWQYKNNQSGSAFAAKYKIDRLVWYETFPTMEAAIACEKKIKGWRREKKIALIEKHNPGWEDLAAGWREHSMGKANTTGLEQSNAPYRFS